MATPQKATSTPVAGSKAEKNAHVELPTNISWQQTTTITKGGFSSQPVPAWALDSVKKSYDDTKADHKTPALTNTFTDEKQAKAVLHQLRRAAKELGYGLAARIEGATLTFQAKEKKVVTPKAV